MAVHAYTRVSTRQQLEEGLSLEAQERQIRGYAQFKGMQIDTWFVERAVSGGKPLQQRPEGRALLECLKSGDVVLCAKLDRMFRSATDALNVADLLKKTGVSLHLLDVGDVTSNGIGRVFFTVIASFAQFERERIAERVAEVKAGERAKHSFLGGHRPFGFDVTDGVLAPNPTEQDALATARSMRAGGGSFRSIAKHLRGLGVNVSHVTVARILNTEQKSYLPV